MAEPVGGVPRIDRAVSAALLAAYVALKLDDRVGLFAYAEQPLAASAIGHGIAAFPAIQQLAAGIAVPGYRAPGGSVGWPFGPAAEGIFFTEGTPDIAAWSRSDFFGADVVGELNTASGHALRAGGSAKLFRVENYERVLAYLPGSLPNYARFYPRTLTSFVEVRLEPGDVAHAARLGATAELTIVFDELGKGEKIVRKRIKFERGGPPTKRFALAGKEVKGG